MLRLSDFELYSRWVPLLWVFLFFALVGTRCYAGYFRRSGACNLEHFTTRTAVANLRSRLTTGNVINFTNKSPSS